MASVWTVFPECFTPMVNSVAGHIFHKANCILSFSKWWWHFLSPLILKYDVRNHLFLNVWINNTVYNEPNRHHNWALTVCKTIVCRVDVYLVFTGHRKKAFGVWNQGFDYNQFSEIVGKFHIELSRIVSLFLFAKLFCSQQYFYIDFLNYLVPCGEMSWQMVC